MRMTMALIAVALLAIGMGSAEECWSYEGGIVPYAYDPFNNGLGPTVVIYNSNSYPVPLNQIGVSLGGLGYKQMEEDAKGFLQAGESMQITVECANPYDVIYIEAHEDILRDGMYQGGRTREWYINQPTILKTLAYNHYIQRIWEIEDGEIHFLDKCHQGSRRD